MDRENGLTADYLLETKRLLDKQYGRRFITQEMIDDGAVSPTYIEDIARKELTNGQTDKHPPDHD